VQHAAGSLVRELFAVAEREQTLEAVLPFLDPAIEWTDGIVTKSTLQGHEGFVEAMATLEREGYRSESRPEGYDELDDQVVVAYGVTRLTSGTSYTDLPAYWAFSVRNGRVVRGASATRRAEALAAIGHTE
jgi:ketosteroid isomerase-like protein